MKKNKRVSVILLVSWLVSQGVFVTLSMVRTQMEMKYQMVIFISMIIMTIITMFLITIINIIFIFSIFRLINFVPGGDGYQSKKRLARLLSIFVFLIFQTRLIIQGVSTYIFTHTFLQTNDGAFEIKNIYNEWTYGGSKNILISL